MCGVSRRGSEKSQQLRSLLWREFTPQLHELGGLLIATDTGDPVEIALASQPQAFELVL